MKRTYYPMHIKVWKEIVILTTDEYQLGFKKPYYKKMLKEWLIKIMEWITEIETA